MPDSIDQAIATLEAEDYSYAPPEWQELLIESRDRLLKQLRLSRTMLSVSQLSRLS